MANMQRTAVPIWRIVVGGLIVVGICSLLCWRLGWCWWCPRCPDVDCCEGADPAARIILEDTHAGVWMAMDNTSFQFDDPDDPSDDGHPSPKSICTDTAKGFGECDGNYEIGAAYRHGVLFQTGPVVEVSATKGTTVETRYGGVYIEHDGGGEWLLPPENGGVPTGTDFDWLDVMEGGTKCVIDPQHAYEMLHTLADYNKVPDHVALHSGTTEDLTTNECDAVNLTTEFDLACARNRSIHASLLPTRIVTYWAGEGPDYYEMASGPTTEIPIKRDDGSESGPTHKIGSSGDYTNHVSYTFDLPQQVVVDRWKNGCIEQRYTGVKLIRILYHDSSLYHLGFPHKPMDGG